MESFDRDRPQWPMTFAMKEPTCQWWQHTDYRGPNNESVEVVYCKTKEESEIEAQNFASEPVLGFDMEWPVDADRRPRLQDKVAVIQLASERRIALFHIALHKGDTPDDLIAPTLKRILVSPRILKVGVAVLSVDFQRLQDHFQIAAKGAFELSHLHNLVNKREHATTRLCALAKQVEQHLGQPLLKGSVRQSDWSCPLNQMQIHYAACDVYAGFMLFHCMNSKRIAMKPAPPLPRLSEEYLPFGRGAIRSIDLDMVGLDGERQIITAEDFFRPVWLTDALKTKATLTPDDPKPEERCLKRRWLSSEDCPTPDLRHQRRTHRPQAQPQRRL